jgi:hypothetical protein
MDESLDSQPCIPPEQEVTAAIWDWASLPRGERTADSAFNSDRDLSQNLEFYWRGILSRLPSGSLLHGWCCGGVVETSLTKLNATRFRLDGIMWLLGNGGDMFPAPCELEFRFTKPLDPEPRLVIARVGGLDSRGHLQRYKTPSHAHDFLRGRPHSDRDWAVAVDVTPQVSE